MSETIPKKINKDETVKKYRNIEKTLTVSSIKSFDFNITLDLY